MLKPVVSQSQAQMHLFKAHLESFIDPSNELILLGKKINWAKIEADLGGFYADFGAPAKPIRLMAGLLILKQMFNESDENIVVKWAQNPYYQHFTGGTHFEWGVPCEPSDLSHFRKRMGSQGIESIFKASQELHQEKINQAQTILVDTTVQEKNISFPTDDKLSLKIIKNTLQFADNEDIKLKQTFAKEVKELKIKLRLSRHTKHRKTIRKARKRIKTIGKKLVRQVAKQQKSNGFDKQKELYMKVLVQKRGDKNKIYSLHEPQIACIAKGKAGKPYEFGSKISVAMLPQSNVILDMSHFEGNPNDSKTLEPVLQNIEKRLGKTFQEAIVDRGYRGNTNLGGTKIIIPSPEKDRTQSIEYQDIKRKKCKSRAAIEPIISHLKYDCRMLKSYLKGALGDTINALMAGAAFNFRLAMNEIKEKTKKSFYLYQKISLTLLLFFRLITSKNLKMAC